VFSEAIESHVENHKQKVKNPKDFEAEAERNTCLFSHAGNRENKQVIVFLFSIIAVRSR